MKLKIAFVNEQGEVLDEIKDVEEFDLSNPNARGLLLMEIREIVDRAERRNRGEA